MCTSKTIPTLLINQNDSEIIIIMYLLGDGISIYNAGLPNAMPPKVAICCIFFCSFSICVFANLTTIRDEQPYVYQTTDNIKH